MSAAAAVCSRADEKLSGPIHQNDGRPHAPTRACYLLLAAVVSGRLMSLATPMVLAA
jgi:hypothetical protein